MHITKWKKPIWKSHMYYDHIPEKAKSDSKRISGLENLRGKEGWTGRRQRIFRAVKLFCVIL